MYLERPSSVSWMVVNRDRSVIEYKMVNVRVNAVEEFSLDACDPTIETDKEPTEDFDFFP